MPTSQLRNRRGASTVELAIAMLVVVPMVTYTAYLGEAFMTSVKAQQAEITASWQLTAYRIHDYGGNADKLNTSKPQPNVTQSNRKAVAQAAAKRVEAGLNAGALAGGFSAGRGVITELDCRTFVPKQKGLLTFSTLLTMNSSESDDWLESKRGFFACSSTAEFQSQGTRDFELIEKQTQPLIGPKAVTLKFCGIGPGVSGCNNPRVPGLPILTDDWAVDDPHTNTLAEPVAPNRARAGNRQFYGLSQAVYRSYIPDNVQDRSPIGAEQIREVASILTGSYQDVTEVGKYGNYDYNLSSFRLATAGPLSSTPDVSVDVGTGTIEVQRFRMLPYDDGESADPAAMQPSLPFVSGKQLYNRRVDNFYLGHPSANYNSP